MNAALPRRSFLKTAAPASGILGLGDLGFVNALRRVSAAEAKLDPRGVSFTPAIEPLVRLLEDTPRNRVLEEFGARIKRGTTYREGLAALLLAGVRNIQPRPVGFKFHAVLVVNSAHLASQNSPDADRWLPIFCALDQFKSLLPSLSSVPPMRLPTPHSHPPCRAAQVVAVYLFSAALVPLVMAAQPPESAPSVASTGIIELPPYTVVETRDLPPPEAWSYAQADGLEILSNASNRATQGLVRYLRRFAQALDVVWPGLQQTSSHPLTLIICGSGGKFEQFVPAAADRQIHRGKVTLGFHAKNHTTLVIDHESKVIELSVNGRPMTEIEVDAYQQLTREYVRFLLLRGNARFPAWFVEGMAQILMAMEIHDTFISVGRVEDPNLVQLPGQNLPQEWDRTFNGALRGRALIPMPEFLAVTHDAPEVLNPVGGTWPKQAAAFVHWGIYGNGGRHQKAFLKFVTASTREPVTEQLFRECFGMTYSKMLDELRGYAEFTSYKLREFRARKGEKLPPVSPLALRKATQAEIGRMKGETLRLAGHVTAARTALVAAYVRGERDPLLLGALGAIERHSGDPERARRLLEAAVEAKPDRAQPYMELARLRAEANAANKPDQRWSEAEVHAVVTPLLAAYALGQPESELYEMLANVWLMAEAKPELPQLKIVDEGVRRFPRNVRLIYDLSLLMERVDRIADALYVARHGKAVSQTDAVRQKFEDLESRFTAAAQSSPPPPTAKP